MSRDIADSLRFSGAVFLWSRLLVAAVAIAAAAIFGVHDGNAGSFDSPALTHPFGGLGDALFSPLARWDSVWYIGIARSGYDRASTNRVAEEAGCSIGSLYQYFPSKEALVAAVVERHIQKICEMYTQKMMEVTFSKQ